MSKRPVHFKIVVTLLLVLMMAAELPRSPAFAQGPERPAADDLIAYGVYKGEPVLWRVLDAEQTNMGTEGMFLLSDGLLDSGLVMHDESSTLWEGSAAQQWCTDFAAAAFTPEESALIPAASKDEEEAHLYELTWRENSLRGEQVFFLSAIELDRYFGSQEGRPKYTVKDSSLESYWWLRSPHRYHDDYHGIVLQDNMVHDHLPYTLWAARPCINLEVQNAVALLPVSDSGEPGPVQSPEESDGRRVWKLVAPTAEGSLRIDETTERDGVLTVRYSEAAAEENRMLSLAVCDRGGKTLQYIRLARPESAVGSLELSREELGLPDDARLFLTEETVNAAYLSNTAGPLRELVPTTPAEPAEPDAPTPAGEQAAPIAELTEENGAGGENKGFAFELLLLGLLIILALLLVLAVLLYKNGRRRTGAAVLRVLAVSSLLLLVLTILWACGVIGGGGTAGTGIGFTRSEKAVSTPTPSPAPTPEPTPTPTPFPEPVIDGESGPCWFDGKQLPSGRLLVGDVEYVRLSEVAEALELQPEAVREAPYGYRIPWRNSEIVLAQNGFIVHYLDSDRPMDAPALLCDGGEDMLLPVYPFCAAAEIGVYYDEELDELTCTPGTGSWVLPGGCNVPVMMYHGVGDAAWDANLIVSQYSLEEQFQYLNDHGFTTVWFEDLWNVENIQKPIILIFDDGWWGCYDWLMPLAEQYQIKAAIAVVPSFTDRSGVHLNSAQLNEIKDCKYLTLYSHTMSHDPPLTELSDAHVVSELRDSEQWIVRLCHREPVALVYPTGGSSDFIQETTREYYRFGVKMTHPDIRAGVAWTSYNTSDDPTLVYRYFVQRQTPLETYAEWIEYPFAEG
ncbi:MAG: polysaccharide deacetylase family protein [Oscillospiraceae bacterium]|nr:polysaccharide deacetylase family protein [Oscillospiraceae bacterium]